MKSRETNGKRTVKEDNNNTKLTTVTENLQNNEERGSIHRINQNNGEKITKMSERAIFEKAGRRKWRIEGK